MLKFLQRSIPLTILAVLLATVAPSGSQAQSPRDAAVVYQEYLDAANRGDAVGAAAVFTDDAVFIVSGCPVDIGCVGRAAIQARYDRYVANHQRFKIISIQRNNNIITAVEEHRGDPQRAAGLERTVAKVTLTFSGDKISRRAQEPDLSDPQTAAFVALPAPPPPATAVRPPSTGDAGLLGDTSARH